MNSLPNARLFDGKTSLATNVTVGISDRYITLYLPDGGEQVLSKDSVYLCEKIEKGKPLRLRKRKDDGFRLIFDDPHSKAFILETLPGLAVDEGATRAKVRLAAGIIGFSTAIALLIWQGMPLMIDLVIAVYPRSMEMDMGRNAREQIVAIMGEDRDGTSACAINDPAQKVITTILGRFEQTGALTYDYQTTVLRSDIENALALPGGQIIVFSELIKKAENPEALAGVLAHEIGHTEMQHGLKKLFSSIALGQLVRLMTGGADLPVGFVMEQSYSRDMETDADHFALELMGDASIETQSTAKLFRTISTESRYAEIASFLPEILSSHPEMTGRIDLFEQSDITGTLDINPQDWKALQTVCD